MPKPSKLAKRDALIDAIFALSEKVSSLERRQARMGAVITLRERLAEQLCINRRLMEEKAKAWGQTVLPVKSSREQMVDRIHGLKSA